MSFKCKMCGGIIENTENKKIATCEYCGSSVTLPSFRSEKSMRLYDRASYLRLNDEYDKAMSLYEMILAENNEDAEAYWSILLCTYGINYVEDPVTHKRIPTVNRLQYKSIKDDENYKLTLKYCTDEQRTVYEKEADVIADIQKNILDISKKEQPYDVFICYKEKDSEDKRTMDSVFAQNVYDALTEKGLKVFFSRVTLKNKLGKVYEPYIFSALNSAKILLAVGTSAENYYSPWVKNEWSRFLSIMKGDNSKELIPLFKDMSPYELPSEFGGRQGIELGSIGYMQYIIDGVFNIINKDQKKVTNNNHTFVSSNPYIAKNKNINDNDIKENLKKRIEIYLSDEAFDKADEYCERVLDIDPENWKIYVYKMLAKFECKDLTDLGKLFVPIFDDPCYKKAYKYGDDECKKMLASYNEYICGNIYVMALVYIDEYKDAEAIYNKEDNFEEFIDNLLLAKEMLEGISSFKDAQAILEQVEKYIFMAERIYKNINRVELVNLLNVAQNDLKDWPSAKIYAEKIQELINNIDQYQIEMKEEEKRKKKRGRRITIFALFAIISVPLVYYLAAKICEAASLDSIFFPPMFFGWIAFLFLIGNILGHFKII